jgi:hypothetical protein
VSENETTSDPAASSPAPTPYFADPFNRLFVVACVATAAVFFILAVLLGRELLISGHLWPNDLFFGCDTARNIRTIGDTGIDERSNVHPLFAVTTRPFAQLVQRLGVTPGISAIVVTAAAAALGLLMTALYFRLRGVSRAGAFVGMALTAASATWIFEATLPGTSIFHLWVLAALNCLLVWSLRRPEPPAGLRRLRAALWWAFGVLNYGYTVTAGLTSFLIYGFSRPGGRGPAQSWTRAVGYGALILVSGIALSWLAGSSLSMWIERRWIVETEFHGPGMANPFLHSLSSNLVWSFVAPAIEPAPLPDGRVIYSFINWNYRGLEWLLVAGWLAILLAAARALHADRDPIGRRLNLALLVCLAVHILFHTFYYVTGEGVFIYNGHALFLAVGAISPLFASIDRLPTRRSIAIYSLFALFVLALAARHLWTTHQFQFTIPLPG